ncbi:MAG: serine/threonine-protein kinase [Gemmatimonadaceae bacterium]
METDSFSEELQQALSPAYTIQRELTGGGMSRVFVALEHALGRTVVVKVLKPELGAGVNRERFRREIMLAAQLQHPHIVPVLRAGEHGELLWYTMPFVEGVSLRDSLAHAGAFSARTVTRVLHDVLDALAYAHRRGVIHRDIKPGNILHHGSHSLVTDFGVAKALSAALPHSGTTSVGIAIGTPAYMAPEQLAADPSADHRMDLYAVGLLAYELLTGVQPFSGSSPQATMAAQLTRMPTPVEEACPDVPPGLASLVTRLLAKHPEERPPTASAALAELETLTTATGAPLGGSSGERVGVSARTGDTTALRVVRARSRRAVAIGAAILAIAVAGVLLARTTNSPGTRDSAPQRNPLATAAARPDSTAAAPTTLVRLTHEDSVRIANAVRAQMAKAKLSGSQSATGAKNIDSLRRTLVRAYTDSAMREAAASPAVHAAPRVAGAGAVRTNTKATPAAIKPPIFARPRRVAILPLRDATLKPEVAPTARVLQDSLRRTLVAAGYTPASDGELVQLMASADLAAQRRIADTLGIGAIVMSILSTHGDEIIAQSIVLDVWRNYPISDRTAADLDKPQEALGVIRNVSRALERVSWRSRGDPRRVLLFDLENQTGNDSVDVLARQLADSLRAAAMKRVGVQIVGDSSARATKDVMERRAVGMRLGAGAIMAGSLYRARGDSVTVRLSTRDLSEDKSYPNVEVRASRRELLASFQSYVDHLLTDLGQVNWGPKSR